MLAKRKMLVGWLELVLALTSFRKGSGFTCLAIVCKGFQFWGCPYSSAGIKGEAQTLYKQGRSLSSLFNHRAQVPILINYVALHY